MDPTYKKKKSLQKRKARIEIKNRAERKHVYCRMLLKLFVHGVDMIAALIGFSWSSNH